jgi:hypothetical protein
MAILPTLRWPYGDQCRRGDGVLLVWSDGRRRIAGPWYVHR